MQEAIDFDQAAYDLSQKTTQLNILAVFYGEYGCFSNTWPDASGTSGGSLSTASVSLQCPDETWQISTDGGATWSDIDVPVCEYQI